MIPQETIDQIRQATDIVQLIGEYLRLKKRGRNSLALCPFHTEKTPSFNVSSDKQIFHCFGCGKGGNIYTFLMEHEKMSFVEAVRFLAQRANITIQEEKETDYNRERFERLNFANQVAVEFYHNQLKLPRYKAVLEDYLTAKRNISADAIEYFKLGLAGEEWDGLLNYASKKGLKAEDLMDAGLVLKSEKKQNYFDRFRTRLMIPIFNLSRKPIAFGGRTLKKGEPAKYMNSPETALYIKGNILYNLINARDSIRKSKQVFVVEGYFDVISLWQIGIENVVASSGTAFTQQQARLLARFAEEVYLFFDADSAGRNAALKSVDSLYDAGLEVKVIEPPDGEDPDSIAQKFGPEKIEELKTNAIGFIPFRVRNLDLKTTGIIGKEKLIKELSLIGTKIIDPTRRTLFFQEASGYLNVDPTIFNVGQKGQTISNIPPSHSKKFDPYESELLSLLFNNPGNIDSVLSKISEEDFDSRDLARVYAAITTQYNSSGVVDAQKLIDNNPDVEFISLITKIASKEWDHTIIDSETTKMATQILENKKRRIRNSLKQQLADAENAGDNDKAASIQEEIKRYGF